MFLHFINYKQVATIKLNQFLQTQIKLPFQESSHFLLVEIQSRSENEAPIQNGVIWLAYTGHVIVITADRIFENL